MLILFLLIYIQIQYIGTVFKYCVSITSNIKLPRAAKLQAVVKGVWGHAPKKIFKKWCNFVRFEGYFQPLSLWKSSQKIINKQEFFHWPFYNAAPPLIYDDWCYGHTVFENSAYVLYFGICCATILVIFASYTNFVMHKHITYYTQWTDYQCGF